MTKMERKEDLKNKAVTAGYFAFFGAILISMIFLDKIEAETRVDDVPIPVAGTTAALLVDDYSVDIEGDNLTAEAASYVEESTEAVTEESYLGYTDYEYRLLAVLIFAEGGGTRDLTTELYIGSVVLNRVSSQLYPDNIHDVIYQGNGSQYDSIRWMWSKEDEVTDECWYAAEYLLTNGSILPSYVLGQSSYATTEDGVYEVRDGIYFDIIYED